MKTRITILLVALTLMATSAVTVMAGIEPSPFRINSQRLDVVASNIGGLTTMVDAVMGIDPIPMCPAPDSVKAEEIRDLAKQMQRIEDEVIKTLVHPPEPGLTENDTTCYEDPGGELAEKLTIVKDKVIIVINKVLSHPPNPVKELDNALNKLYRNSMSIIEMINAFMPPDLPCPDCAPPS